MGKLIELFNKRVIEKGLRDDEIFNGEEDVKENILYLPNLKSFVKWLVDNDKIDIKALVVKGEMRSGWDFDNKKGDEEVGEESWNKYYSELCLMILAIQDESIEFLISILENV